MTLVQLTKEERNNLVKGQEIILAPDPRDPMFTNIYGLDLHVEPFKAIFVEIYLDDRVYYTLEGAHVNASTSRHYHGVRVCHITNLVKELKVEEFPIF